MLKAIQTEYKGYLFRSRLEARWAVFFDTLGWEWEYEKEGFVLEDGTRYLPDFYLPELDVWFEVKPDFVLEEDKRRCKLLSKDVPNNTFVLIGCGLPSPVQFVTYHQGEEVCSCTLTTYIRSKNWSTPYFGGDWWEHDKLAFVKAKQARFEFLS